MGAALDLVLGDLHEAVVVVGEQQLLGLARALRVDALADERRARLLDERRRRRSSSSDVRRRAGPGAVAERRGRRTRSAIARMCSGVVPQQPPTMPTP